MFKEDYYQKLPIKVQEKLISSTVSTARSFTKQLMQQDQNIAKEYRLKLKFKTGYKITRWIINDD